MGRRKGVSFTMGELQDDIGDWASQTFEQTTQTIASHLLSEAVELCKASGISDSDMLDIVKYTINGEYNHSVAGETADVAMLALVMADYRDFDLEAEVRAKLAINKQRKWSHKPNSYGFTEHVKEKEEKKDVGQSGTDVAAT